MNLKDDEYISQVFYKNNLFNLQKNNNCAHKIIPSNPLHKKAFDAINSKNFGKKILADGSWGPTKRFKKSEFYKLWDGDKKLIAKKEKKKEPTQTQQAAKLEEEQDIINTLGKYTGDYYFFAYNTKGEKFWGSTRRESKDLQLGETTSSKGYICNLRSEWIKKTKPYKGTFSANCESRKLSFKGSWTQDCERCSGIGQAFTLDGEVITAIFNIDRKKVAESINAYFSKESKTIKIAEKKEFKPKKKKKKKVVKVVEQEQEEIKVKIKKKDTTGPIIEIAEAITVDSQSYTLKGKVKDKSKQIYLTIDDRPVEVKRGKFKVDRFNIDPEVVEEIKIVAIDKWNNRSEKIVKVTVKLKETQVVKAYEELKPNRIKVSKDDNKVAIIIGIEKYVNLTNLDAPFANRDAKAFKTYATRALGVKSSNTKLLVDDKAGRPQILEAFKLWLPRIAGDGGKEIYVFFSGHGLASDDGKDLYILPQNGNSLLLEDTAITRVQLISLIQKINPKSVTMFFDTCYSGQTRGEQMLLASLKPIRIVAGEQDTPNNFTIFSASNFDQTSGTIKETKYGMFSYYLMKGLEGKADGNKDKQITNGELIAYLKTNVSKEAFTQNRNQDPMLTGNPDQVLMRYR